MKKLLTIAALLFGVSAFTYAQDRQMPSPELRSERQAEALARRLTLSQEQKVQVQALFLAQAKTTDSLRNAANGNFQGFRGKIQPVQEATERKIFSLLNEDQKKQYEAYQEERRSRMPGQREGQ